MEEQNKEEKYMKKRIKRELIKKPIDEWNKESIHFLIYIYKYPKYNKLYDSNLLLLDKYIKWYKIKENKELVQDNMYNIDKLIKLYVMIKEDIYYEYNYDYTHFLNDDKNKNKNNFVLSFIYELYYFLFGEKFCSLSFGLMLTIFYLIIKYLYNLLFLCKKEEEKKLFDFKIPISDNILNIPFIKQLLNDKFLI